MSEKEKVDQVKRSSREAKKRPLGLDSASKEVDTKRIHLQTQPGPSNLTREQFSDCDTDSEPEQEEKNDSAKKEEPKKKPIEQQKILCVPAPFESEIKPESSSDDRSRPADVTVAHAQAATDRLWPKNQNVLKVYFLNPSVLQSVGLNEQDIMSWANRWEGQTNKWASTVPKFRLTQEKSAAKIRVQIVDQDKGPTSSSGSWSCIGVDAERTVLNPDDPTMVLDLRRGMHDYNQYVTVHEFGHALGLLHEHQRTEFWSIAEKFIDKDIMKRDPRLCGIDLDKDYFKANQSGLGSVDYDPDSVMHYWFDKAWLKKNVQTDPLSDQLSDKDKEVLVRIRESRSTRQLPCNPSKTDLSFLKKCYGYDKIKLEWEMTTPAPIDILSPNAPVVIGNSAYFRKFHGRHVLKCVLDDAVPHEPKFTWYMLGGEGCQHPDQNETTCRLCKCPTRDNTLVGIEDSLFTIGGLKIPETEQPDPYESEEFSNKLYRWNVVDGTIQLGEWVESEFPSMNHGRKQVIAFCYKHYLLLEAVRCMVQQIWLRC